MKYIAFIKAQQTFCPSVSLATCKGQTGFLSIILLKYRFAPIERDAVYSFLLLLNIVFFLDRGIIKATVRLCFNTC